MDQLERAGEPNHRLARPFASQPEPQKYFSDNEKSAYSMSRFFYFPRAVLPRFSISPYFISCKVTLASFSSSL